MGFRGVLFRLRRLRASPAPPPAPGDGRARRAGGGGGGGDGGAGGGGARGGRVRRDRRGGCACGGRGGRARGGGARARERVQLRHVGARQNRAIAHGEQCVGVSLCTTRTRLGFVNRRSVVQFHWVAQKFAPLRDRPE